jgi:hypothetical protein
MPVIDPDRQVHARRAFVRRRWRVSREGGNGRRKHAEGEQGPAEQRGGEDHTCAYLPETQDAHLSLFPIGLSAVGCPVLGTSAHRVAAM